MPRRTRERSSYTRLDSYLWLNLHQRKTSIFASKFGEYVHSICHIDVPSCNVRLIFSALFVVRWHYLISLLRRDWSSQEYRTLLDVRRYAITMPEDTHNKQLQSRDKESRCNMASFVNHDYHEQNHELMPYYHQLTKWGWFGVILKNVLLE